MALKLSGNLFTGPFPIDKTEVRANQSPVVYAIIARGGASWAPTFRVLDIGYSEDNGLRFAEAPNRATWTAPDAQIGVYLFYAPREDYSLDERRSLAQALRQTYNPPHGLVDA